MAFPGTRWGITAGNFWNADYDSLLSSAHVAGNNAVVLSVRVLVRYGIEEEGLTAWRINALIPSGNMLELTGLNPSTGWWMSYTVPNPSPGTLLDLPSHSPEFPDPLLIGRDPAYTLWPTKRI